MYYPQLRVNQFEEGSSSLSILQATPPETLRLLCVFLCETHAPFHGIVKSDMLGSCDSAELSG